MSYAKKRVEEGKIPRKKGFPYEGRPTYTVDWSEHPSLRAIDVYVADNFGKEMGQSYTNTAYRRANCVSDVKVQTIRWVEERLDELETILEMAQKLPEDTQATYTIDERTGEVVR